MNPCARQNPFFPHTVDQVLDLILHTLPFLRVGHHTSNFSFILAHLIFTFFHFFVLFSGVFWSSSRFIDQSHYSTVIATPLAESRLGIANQSRGLELYNLAIVMGKGRFDIRGYSFGTCWWKLNACNVLEYSRAFLHFIHNFLLAVSSCKTYRALNIRLLLM